MRKLVNSMLCKIGIHCLHSTNKRVKKEVFCRGGSELMHTNIGYIRECCLCGKEKQVFYGYW